MPVPRGIPMSDVLRLWVQIHLIAVLLATPLAARQAEPYRESVEVRVINVDVYVEDGDGRAVPGLTADDFVILEDGEPQPITNFAEYRSGTFVEPPESAPTTTAEIRAQLPRQPRTIVFLVDAFNQTPGEREELFGRIRAFMRDGLEQGDRAALFNWRNGMTTVVPLTEDLQQIDRALSAMGGLQLPAEDQGLDELVQFLEEADRFRRGAGEVGGSSLAAEMGTTIRNCAEEYLSEMESKSVSIRRMIDTLSGLEGKKILVYVAGRFPADTATYCQSILRTPQLGPASFTFRAGTFSTDRVVDAITDAANAAGVTFYPIRPRTDVRRVTMVEYYGESALGASEDLGDTLVIMNDADALATLAEQTGGRLAVGDHMVDDLLPEIISDLDNYYSIGYRATSDGSDRERRISVRMKSRDLRARTRTAFIEKSRLTEVKDRLIANLIGEPNPGEIELDVVVGEPAPDHRGRSILPVEVRIPLDQLIYAGATPVSQVRLLSAAGTTPGAVTEISETLKRIEQPPADLPSPFITWKVDLVMAAGGTKVAFGILDELSGLAGFATVDRTTESLARREREALESLSEWDRALRRGHAKGKPLLVYFRPEPCYTRSGFNRIQVCEDFENDLLAHPEITQRLEHFELIRHAPDGETAGWPKGRPGLALMRIDGESIVRWPELPDGVNLVRVLATIAPHAAELVRINELIRVGRSDEGDYSTAMLQIRFGLRREATATLERLAGESETHAEIAAVALAYLEAGENRSRGLSRLRSLTSTTSDPVAIGEAWLAIAALTSGEERTAALETAAAVAPEGSSQKTIARNELQKLKSPAEDVSVIRIAPVSIVSGRTELRTMVRSSHVASVEFILDGRSIVNDTSAPFRAIVDFDRLPTRHELRVVARDPAGSILGEDALTLNGRTDSLWVRFVAPESDVVSGEANVELVLQVPEGESIGRVEIEHDGTVYEVDGPPYRTAIPVPPDRISVLTARVVLPDGRSAEDIRILNARGLAETAGVHLVELPLVPVGDQPLLADQIRVVESGKSREVEALIGADAAPLTLGMVIDVSGSMFERILDLQASAASLVGRVLGAEDRGFLVSFDSEARLEVGVTSDRDRLVREIRSLSPLGSTALFDGMMLGLLQFEPLGGRRALIVFSDGDDRASRYKLEDVAEVTRRVAVPIYLIRLLSEEDQRKTAPAQAFGGPSSALLDRQQQGRLEHLTRESGGGFFQLDSLDAIESVFAEIGRMVSRQVLVTYLTESSRNDEWRKVEVRVEGKGSVRAPQGYYARPR